MQQRARGIWYKDWQISFLLFTDDVVLLVIFCQDLKHALWMFVAEYEVAWMRIGSSKSKTMVRLEKGGWSL